MNRRTFLKGLFAATVAPASVVRCLYSPPRKNLTTQMLKALVTSCEFDTLISTDARSFKEEWNEYYYGYTGITGELIEEFRAARRATKFQPPKRRS